MLAAVDREETVGGRPRRYFRITGGGERAVREEAARMERAAGIVRGRHAPRTGTAQA